MMNKADRQNPFPERLYLGIEQEISNTTICAKEEVTDIFLTIAATSFPFY